MASEDAPAIERATGMPWPQWVEALSTAGGADLTHQQIVQAAQRAMPNDVTNPEWWAQTVTVAYERHIGRRSVGQNQDGSYDVAVSRTLAMDQDEALAAWQESTPEGTVIGEAVVGESFTTATAKWRRWRATMSDGTSLGVSVGTRGAKSVITATWSRLASADQRESRRALLKVHLSHLVVDGQ